MGKSILDVINQTAKGLTDAGVMDVKTMSDFEELTQYNTSDYLESMADIECYLEAVLDSDAVEFDPELEIYLESELGYLKIAVENVLVAMKRLGESDERD